MNIIYIDWELWVVSSQHKLCSFLINVLSSFVILCCRHSTNVDSTLGHRIRRCPNISTTLVECPVFAGFYPTVSVSLVDSSIRPPPILSIITPRCWGRYVLSVSIPPRVSTQGKHTIKDAPRLFPVLTLVRRWYLQNFPALKIKLFN